MPANSIQPVTSLSLTTFPFLSLLRQHMIHPFFFLSISVLFFFNFIYFWLRWVFIAAHGLSLVAASGGYSSLWCTVFSLRWLLLLWSTGSRAHGLQYYLLIHTKNGDVESPRPSNNNNKPQCCGMIDIGKSLKEHKIKCSRPSVPAGDWFQDPSWIPNSRDA